MAQIIDILPKLEEMTKQDLIAFTTGAYATAVTALKDNKLLQEKVKHLEELLKTPVETLIKTPEQATIENQIGRFTELAMARQLTNEEIKSLDILIKNKMLLSGQATTIPGEVKRKKALTDSELITLARIEKKE